MIDRVAFLGIVLASSCAGAAFSLYLLPQYRQARALDSIAGEMRAISQAIQMQTAQQSWLVSHYAEPTRPLFPWEKHRCEWCGGEKLEDDDK